MSRRFSTKDEDRKKRIKEFQEILSTLDKDSIIEAFKMGLKIGMFGKRSYNDDLFLQFNDGRKFVYTIARMPIKKQQKQNIIEKVINEN